MLLLIVLSAWELSAWVFFKAVGDRFTFFDINTAVIDAPTVERLRKSFNPTLGWKTLYHTPFGERPRRDIHEKNLLATFGDSFTHCDGVSHEETWQTYLAQRIGENVLNFGNGAYGTDQAYLRFLEDYPQVRTPLVSLGVMPENINRLVSVYRKFYYPKTGIPATKPRFLLKDGKLELLKNPIQRAEDLDQLRLPDQVAALGSHDMWFNRNSFPTLGFPYLSIFFHRSFWIEALYGSGRTINDVDPQPWANLWDDLAVRSLMFEIIDRFVHTARSFHAQPFLMIIPAEKHLLQTIKTGEDAPGVQHLIAHANESKYPVFNGVDVLFRAINTGDTIDDLYKVHMTPHGNALLAEGLYQFLVSNKMVEPNAIRD